MIKLPDEIVNLNKRHDARYQELLKMAVEAVREADELRAEVQRLNATAQPVSDGWVKCSERMPESDGQYWGWWSEDNRQGPVWFSAHQSQFQSYQISHWMPLPAAPGGQDEQ